MPFNFIKLGSYKKEFGPLNKSTTNQKLYLVVGNPAILEDITYKPPIMSFRPSTSL